MEHHLEAMAESKIDGVVIHSGFPNPAADRQSTPLSLDRLLVKHPISTYLFRIRGHAWEERGIFDGDIALVDRAISPRPTNLVITWEEQEFTIIPLAKAKKDTEPWGTLTTIIHQYMRGDL